mmetsp:Transcript_34707/g.81026  ORF Transcript_34707/g.81026 Transcript_34707/m.81026 type:complete len:141 (+) Transcript_34707:69-491(+)
MSKTQPAEEEQLVAEGAVSDSVSATAAPGDVPADQQQAEQTPDALATPTERGPLRRLAGLVSGLSARLWDNMTFTGEVLIEWLDLDKPRYYHEMKSLQKAQRREEKRREAEEVAADRARLAGMEEAAGPATGGLEQNAER